MHQKIDQNKERVLLIICSLIFILASFRTGTSGDDAVDYFVPAYVALVQKLSLLLVGALMLVSIFINLSRTDRSGDIGIPVGLVCYFVFQLIIVLTDFLYKSDLQDFFVRVGFIILTFFYFFYVLRSLPLYSSVNKGVLVYFFYGAIVFVAINVFLALYPGANVVWKGRLFGVTAHPNFLGMCTAIAWIVSFALFMEGKTLKIKMFFLIAMLLSIYGSILTGSRTSLLSGTIGVTFISSYTMKNSSFKPVFVLGTLIFGLFLYANLTLSSLDFAGRGNTREGTWGSMLEQASELPLFGYGKVGATTNAFLFSIVATGIFGTIFFFRSLLELIRLFFAKLPQYNNMIVNLFRGLAVFFLISSTFEGYLLDSVSMPVFTYWLLLTYVKF
ncbi:hypothetical protein RYH73_17800 [Olivibacter sp. CPCC 100613]|uniref:O-antigen ligase family protein n=1 Tax=Olivibacter sp. CPCC 100613 TaxID=3079931 RepID=UPI002FF84D8A